VVRRGPSAVLWSAIEAASAGVFSLTSAFIIARIVGPAELGVGAAAVSLHILFWVGVNAFFADAMVQRATLNEEDATSAFWASTAAGVLAGVIQAALGVMLARAIGDTRLVWMAVALGATLPATGAAGAVQGMLTRNGRYKMLAYRTLVGQGAGTVTGISLAACGAGAWAVAAQQLVTSAVGAAVLLVSVNWRPRRICHWSAVRELVAVGGPLTASTLVLHGLPHVRLGDWGHRWCGSAGRGASRVPSGRYCTRTGFHRSLAADAACDVGAPREPRGVAGMLRTLAGGLWDCTISALRRHAGLGWALDAVAAWSWLEYGGCCSNAAGAVGGLEFFAFSDGGQSGSCGSARCRAAR
jgi:Polysaccharide biosynthesis protein